MLCVALDRFHQVRNQVVTALELYIYLAPGILYPLPETDQTVLDPDQGKDQNRDENQKADKKTHEYLPLLPGTPYRPAAETAGTLREQQPLSHHTENWASGLQ